MKFPSTSSVIRQLIELFFYIATVEPVWDGDERKAEYDITVPDVGKYSISAEKPAGTDIFFITKISLVLQG
ncbi:hypothetical protein BC351_36585 [Paenibacillus ferrarius]|uniref:Uncharacterized protein n=1 Tax=Paenibacillus ferrarius TaxID=1469647 RepID=A0A1V4HBQ5_9BACL|nr:hypothetical protein BC351_36585 [Paenibacillus ferrarius]